MASPNPMISSTLTPHILVVEDDFENRSAMVRVLEGAGYKTTETDNGEEAINNILMRSIDIVVSDLQLPGMDGVELLKRAKAVSADVEVILVTGYGTVAAAVEALKEGASDFITKPVRKAHLLHCVEKAIRDTTTRRKMEAEREIFTRLVRCSSDAILTSTLDRTATSVNPAAEALFGYSAAEMIGRPGFLSTLVPRERTAEAMEVFERVSQGGAVELETVRIKKSGTRCVVSLAVSPIRDGLGRVLGVSEVVRDVTESYRQRQRREFLAEAGKALVSSLDYRETLQTVANLSVRQLGDCCIIEIVQSDGSMPRLAGAFSEPSKEALWERLQKYPQWSSPPFGRDVSEGGGSVLVPEVPPGFTQSVAEDAEHFSVLSELDPKSFMVVPLRARGHLLGSLVFISTRIDRQYGPDDLPFAEEIAATAALAIDNAGLFAQAQRAISARDAVLEVVAHDLRNPLSNIMMSAALLNAKAPAEADPARRFAEQTLKSARQMKRMIEDLLDIASMEAGQLRLSRKAVPVASLIAEVLEANRSQTGGRELTAECRANCQVNADSDRILQVFSNLVGNAIKFTPQRACIAIGAAQEADVVRFWVSDNGPGISPEHLPHLFTRFWQSVKGDRRGVGLGLSICKSIVEAHGGRISVRSEPAHGTTFFFSLPISVPVACAVGAEQCPDADIARPRHASAVASSTK